MLDLIAPFAGIDPAQQRELLEMAMAHRLVSDEHLFDEGAEADRFFLLLDGYIRVIRLSPEGEQVIMLHIPSGQLIGLAPAFGWDRYPASAVAASECFALSWPSERWPDFMKRYPSFAAETLKTVGGRFSESNDRIVEMATLQVDRRVAHMVLRLIEQVGRKTKEGIEIDMQVSRQDLSEMTGSTLHTVSRLMSGWERNGWVKSGRQRIVVTMPRELEILSSGAA
ncbi:MAG: Crp/Fnr family transcriptional regulator [Pikeienuella sp.]